VAKSVKLYVCDSGSTQMTRILDRYFQSCQFQFTEMIKIDSNIAELSPDHMSNKIDMVIGEPNFSFSLLPWHNLFFWFSLHSVFNFDLSRASKEKEVVKEDELKKDDNDNTQVKKISIHSDMVMPKKATLWAVPVQYRDLWKIRAPVVNTEGFDLEPFDKLIMKASDGCDANVEPHPLWEYPCKALGKPKPCAIFDFSKDIHNFKTETLLPLENIQLDDVNGMALWMDWDLSEDISISTGPTKDVRVGEDIVWDVHSKQGVHLFPKHRNVFTGNLEPKNSSTNSSVNCKVAFDAHEGELFFDFSIVC